MSKVETKLPHWDMTPAFPGLESPEFKAAFDQAISSIHELKVLYDRHQILAESKSTTAAVLDDVIQATNALYENVEMIGTYINAFVATDSRNDLAQARRSELELATVELAKLETRLRGWLGALDLEPLIAESKVATDHAFALRRRAEAAKHMMSPGEEDLAASMMPASGSAWARLHGNVTSQLRVEVSFPDGATKDLPMSAVRGLAHSADADVRKAAYHAELAGWERVGVVLAAAMNGVKGVTGVLNARRGWEDSIEPALFSNNVDRQNLEAMQTACVESFPDFRRYLRAKARLLGNQKLPWWDLFAPVGAAATRTWDFSEARDFIVENFGTYSKKMGDLAARAFGENWIDAEPRDGKRDGAFCMRLRGDESRVLSNYEGSFDSVHTLAHELGHAYHNLNLLGRTPLQRSTPMALAETASIFCQTIITNAALGDATDEERLFILENELQDSCQVVVDIHSRFLLEKGVFEGREKRELSVDELNKLMLDAQRQTYGDGLDEEALHQYMWAMKPHYYSPLRSYYNWPYTFGLLFGLGLYAQFEADPDRFRDSYDDLLSSTGMAEAAVLTGRFGFQIREPDFWRSSLDLLRRRIEDFEKLADKIST